MSNPGVEEFFKTFNESYFNRLFAPVKEKMKEGEKYELDLSFLQHSSKKKKKRRRKQ